LTKVINIPDPNTSLGLLVFFAVILGIFWGILSERKNRNEQPIQPDRKTKQTEKPEIKDDLLDIGDSEFDGAILLNDYIFPKEFPEIEENN
jgi:hypothetical protein